MKTAKEMFEGLGYKEIVHCNGFVDYEKDNVVISFYKPLKLLGVNCENNDPSINVWINKEECKAIHEKLKELGWFDD